MGCPALNRAELTHCELNLIHNAILHRRQEVATDTQYTAPVCRDCQGSSYIHRGTINRPELQGTHFWTGKTSPSLTITSPETRCPHDATVGSETLWTQLETRTSTREKLFRQMCLQGSREVFCGTLLNHSRYIKSKDWTFQIMCPPHSRLPLRDKLSLIRKLTQEMKHNCSSAAVDQDELTFLYKEMHWSTTSPAAMHMLKCA